MIDIEPKHLKIITHILGKCPYQFYLFGSRAKGTAKRFSDVDLFYLKDIPIHMIHELEEEFEESDLPYKVDIINYHTCDTTFKKHLSSTGILITQLNIQNFSNK
jgi:predicted nucleotidyltransferase